MPKNSFEIRNFLQKHPRMIIILSVATAYLCLRLMDGEGQLQDTVTGEPIANATVELSCKFTNFIHGYNVYGEVEVTTDLDGYYQFSFFDYFGCFGSFVMASKKGYSRYCGWCLNYVHSRFRDIPERILLTKDQDLTNIKIQGHALRETPDYPPVKTPNVRYHWWYDGFIKAKAIAKSEQEADLVRSYFCSILSELYGQLTQVEKEALDQRSFTYYERASPVNRIHNFEGEVTNFCAKTT